MFLDPPKQSFNNSTNLRIILREKAKNIRQNSFKIKTYQSNNCIKQPRNQDSQRNKSQNFSSMFNRITMQAKKQIIKKKQKSKSKSLHFFNNTFVIQKIVTKQKPIRQDISQLTARFKLPTKIDNNQSLQKLRVKSIQKYKAKKLFKGNSFSRNSQNNMKNINKRKMPTEGSYQKPLSIDEQFQPIGNIQSVQTSKEQIFEKKMQGYEQIGQKINEKMLTKTYNYRKKNFLKIINFSENNEQKDFPYLIRNSIQNRKTTNTYHQGKIQKKKENQKGNNLSPW